MILNGECGQFNPLLLECLQDIQDRIDEEFQNVENQSEEENQERKVHDQIMETTVLMRKRAVLLLCPGMTLLCGCSKKAALP